MSAALRRIFPIALGIVGLAVLAGPTAAQSRDPLPEVRERLKIEAQRVEKEIQDGRMRAYRLLRTNPNDASDIIKRLIGMLRKDTSLSESRRETLAKTLERDIDILRALAGARRAADPAPSATRIEVRRTPDPRVAADKRSAYDTAASRIDSMKGRVIEARSVRDKSGDRFTGTLVQVDKSATPAASDYEFPDDWLEKSKRRSPLAKLTAQERALLEALKKPIKVDFDMQTFQGVIDYLSKRFDQTILIDKQALEEANVTYDTPITLRFEKPVSARTALKRVLADVGLTYVIRNQNIEVTSIARAKEMLTTRTYYIGDLMGVANPLMPAIANQFQMMQAIGTIINTIQGIDPESWEGRGGPGTISFDPVRMSLVIKQSAEVHYMLNGGR
ncbi:MAG TPA: hypothetical protein VH643_12870 [Gemmataceae bacterium]|jgi:hypothetical protein